MSVAENGSTERGQVIEISSDILVIVTFSSILRASSVSGARYSSYILCVSCFISKLSGVWN